MDTVSQESRILRHLRSGKTITALEALKRFGCERLASRVHKLKKRGHDIQSAMVELPNGKRVAKYRLAGGGVAPS